MGLSIHKFCVTGFRQNPFQTKDFEAVSKVKLPLKLRFRKTFGESKSAELRTRTKVKL
jgi:hypothetical protein